MFIRRILPLFAVLFLFFGRALAARPLTVYFFDVGEAEAICLQTPGGQSILIDGGSPPYTTEDGETVQSREVLPLLKKYGIERLDTVIISHAHADHVGGLADVLSELPVAAVYDSGRSHESDVEYRHCIEVVKSKKIDYRQVHDGEVLRWGNDLAAELFIPPDGRFDNLNNNSIIVKITYRSASLLLTGDAQKDEEEWAVRKYGDRLRSAVLKVSHHGSGTSSSRLFLNTVRPRIAVISCGFDTPFGHPHAQTLYALRKRGIKIYRTDYDGTVILTSDGNRWEMKRLDPR